MKMKKIETDQQQASNDFGLATQGGPAFPKAFSKEPVEQAIAELESNAVPEHMEGRRIALSRALRGPRCADERQRALQVVAVVGQVGGQPVEQVGVPRRLVQVVDRLDETPAQQQCPQSVDDRAGRVGRRSDSVEEPCPVPARPVAHRATGQRLVHQAGAGLAP